MSKSTPSKPPAANSKFPGGASRKITHPMFQDLHKELLPYMWTAVINVGIFLAMYKYRRYTLLGHFIIGLGVALVTLLFSFPLLLQTSFPSNPSKKRNHMIIGYVIVGAIALQVILGCLCKLLNLCKVPSIVLYYINKVHVFFGYLMTILCKFQVYYIIDQDHVFWILLAQDCLFFIMTLIRKLFFPTLEAKIQPKDIKNEQLIKITSFSQLISASKNLQSDSNKQTEQKDFCSFANYVYDLNLLRLTHPAGYQIVQSVKNREIDRFIYGMYRAEKLPSLPTNSHSFKSFDLLGKPVALISIPSPYLNMPTQPFEVTISTINSISYNTRIYQVNLSCKQNIKFTGYQSVQQIGRFYSLTANNKITRLYTSVNFLKYSNITLLRKLGLGNLEYPEQVPSKNFSTKQLELVASTERLGLTFQEHMSDNIPLLIKVYEQGTLPNLLINHKIKTLILSPPKGFGLGLAQLQKGTIMNFAGGTGLYPFSDLIDLLYKDYRISTSLSPNIQREIYRQNPILKTSPFSYFKFRLLFACEKLQDVHPITLKQINELNNSKNFTCSMKIKDNEGLHKLNVNIISESFEKVLNSELSHIDDLAKVWLCGPPKMSENISKYFNDTYPQKDLLLIV